MADQQHDERRTIPVTEEALVVERRTVDVGTVSISSNTETRNVVVDEPVFVEELHIERHRIDRPVSLHTPPVTRTEGDTTVIPVLEEVVVVEKRLMLREEVRITRIRRAQATRQVVPLRREEVHVQRSTADHATRSPPDPLPTDPAGVKMNQSVVAVFENRTEAESARHELIAQGIPMDRTELYLGTDADPAPGARSQGEPPEQSEGGIGHFFRSMFGLEDDRPDHYEEAARRGHATLIAHAADEEESDRIQQLLERHNAIDIDEQASQWQSEGQRQARQMPQGMSDAASTDTASIPVIEEELQVGKREVERGRVRVYSRVMERPVEESVTLREESASISRQPVDRPATEADMRAFQEGSMEIRETAEVPVVQKQARVVEEVEVGKQVQERTEKVRDSVRKTEVQVEEDAAPAAAQSERTPPKGKSKPR